MYNYGRWSNVYCVYLSPQVTCINIILVLIAGFTYNSDYDHKDVFLDIILVLITIMFCYVYL